LRRITWLKPCVNENALLCIILQYDLVFGHPLNFKNQGDLIMSKPVSLLARSGLAALAALLLLATPLRTSAAENVKKTFSVRPGGTIFVDSDLGTIEVQAKDNDEVVVEVERSPRGWGDDEKLLNEFELSFRQEGNDVYVTGKFKKGRNWFWNRHSGDLIVRYRITVPKKYNVDLKTAGGSISVDDLEGTAATRTSGGSLHFGNIVGPVTGKTSGGSISLDGCSGTADLKTSGGSLNIGNVKGNVVASTSGGSIHIGRVEGTVEAKTSGGGINVEEVAGDINASTSGGPIRATITRQPKGDCRLHTSGGGITLYVDENIAVSLEASTSGGSVKTDLPVEVIGEIKRSSLRGKINGGGPELTLHTSGGSIRIKKR